MTGRERVRELLITQVQLMTLETLEPGPSRSECRARLNAEHSAIASDLDALAAAREAAGPLRVYPGTSPGMVIVSATDLRALLSALDGKREGGT